MRTNKILACAAIAASLVACNKKNEAVKQDGNTYTSVQLRLAGDNLRADEKDNFGTAAESNVKNISLVANSMSDWATGEFTETAGASNHVLKTTTAKAATAGQNIGMALVVNGIAEFKTNDPEYIYDGAISNVIKDNEFVMTSKKTQKEIKANISKTDAEAAAGTGTEDLTKNFFNLGDVERVVAKGIVMKDATAATEIKDNNNQVIGTVKDVMYAAVNGATKTYALLDKASDRTMSTNQYYGADATSFVSAIDDVNAVPDNNVNSYKLAADAKTAGLVRLSNYLNGGTTNDAIVDYKAIAIATNNDLSPAGVDAGKYFYENSADLTKEGNKSFYRLAYAKIYATFTPAKVWAPVTSATQEFVKKAGTGIWYEETAASSGVIVSGVAPVKDSKKTPGKTYLEGYVKYSKIELVVPTNATFYVGEKDHQFYADKTAALTGATPFAAGQKSHTYKDGKMAWRALWNRQMEDAKIVNGDTRRNNIYVLTINSFTGIGMNYDPSDENDPNLPDPNDNPDDPTNPDNPNNDDPHVENQDTYIAVTATVQPWNVVSRKVDLGNGNDNI